MRKLAALIVAVALACAPAFAGPFDNIHTVAVIAALGDTAQYNYYAAFAWNNSEGEIDVSNAGLDQRALKDVTGLLQGHYIVAPATYDHAQYAHASPGIGLFASKPNLTDLIVARPDRATVDAYVIIVPDDEITLRPVRGPPLKGPGLLRYRATFGDVLADYAYFLVAIVDAKTCRPIAQMTLSLGRTTYNDTVPALRDTTSYEGSGAYEDVTEQQKQAFRDRLGTLLDDSLKPTLTMLGFIPGDVPSYDPSALFN